MEKRIGSSAEEKGSGALTKSAAASCQQRYNVNIHSEMLPPLGCISEKDTCGVKRLLVPAEFLSCHPASNGMCGHLPHLSVVHITSLSLSSPVLAAPWETWQVRSVSHWSEIQNDPRKAQPTANESTLCWQQLLQREMLMGLLLPVISLSWWQP